MGSLIDPSEDVGRPDLDEGSDPRRRSWLTKAPGPSPHRKGAKVRERPAESQKDGPLPSE